MTLWVKRVEYEHFGSHVNIVPWPMSILKTKNIKIFDKKWAKCTDRTLGEMASLESDAKHNFFKFKLVLRIAPLARTRSFFGDRSSQIRVPTILLKPTR